MKDDRVYLNYALECIRRIEKHRRAGRRRFLESDTIQDAVLRNLQTMAESTQRLSDEIKATQPHIRWEEIAGFRNVLVHAYLGIDLETIWGIMQHEVGELRTAISVVGPLNQIASTTHTSRSCSNDHRFNHRMHLLLRPQSKPSQK